MKRFVALLIGLVVATACIALFDPTQVVIGKLSGDAFFESRPTRYWAHALRGDPGLRSKAQARLEQGGTAAVPVLIGIIENHPAAESAELRCTAIEILGKLGPEATSAGPAIVHAVQDKDPHVQAVAITTLSKVGAAADVAVPVLMQQLQGENNVVAARALSQYRAAAAPALDALVGLLKDESQSVEARWNAARTLGKIGPDAVSTVPVLIEMTHDQDATIREHSAEAIGDIGPVVGDDAIEALIKSMSDPATKVRRDAVRSLGYIGPKAKEAVPTIKKLTEDPEEIVRQAAANALKAIVPNEAVTDDSGKSPPAKTESAKTKSEP